MKNGKVSLLSLAFTALLATSASGQLFQQWVSMYPGGGSGIDESKAIAVDESQNVYVTGFINGMYFGTMATVKYDCAGQQQWCAVGTPGIGNDIAVNGAGEVFVAGQSNDYPVIIKYSPTGQQLWVYQHGSSGEFFGLAADDFGNAYATGYQSTPQNDYLTVKCDSSGNLDWLAIYNGPANWWDFARDIALDDSGNAYVTGNSTYLFGGIHPTEYATIKYSPDGLQCWIATFHTTNSLDCAYALEVCPSGNVYVTGAAGSPHDYATVKYNRMGVQQWVQFYSSLLNYGDEAVAISVDANENVFVTGNSARTAYPIIPTTNCVTIKYNSDGAEQWIKDFGLTSDGNDVASAVVSDADGNAYVTGYCDNIPGYGINYDCFIARYSSDGTSNQYVYYNEINDYGSDIAIDQEGDVYVTGYTWPDSWSKIFTVKYSSHCILPTLTPVNPPIVIPASGGAFEFTAELVNISTQSQTFETWIMQLTPAGNWQGPMLGPLVLTLPAGAQISRLRSQTVPAGALPGTYLYCGFVGQFYLVKWDSSYFEYTKLTTGDGEWISEWTCTGESFPGESVGTRSVASVPETFSLSASPNPFNPSSALSFQLLANSRVSLRVYDTAGREVATLVEGWREAGAHEVTFDASGLPSGIYFARLRSDGLTQVQKLILLK